MLTSLCPIYKITFPKGKEKTSPIIEKLQHPQKTHDATMSANSRATNFTKSSDLVLISKKHFAKYNGVGR